MKTLTKLTCTLILTIIVIAVFLLLTTISQIVGLNFAFVAAFFFIFISIYNLL
jgi:hypothetical protein